MQGFRVTYELVTPGSAELGDAAERGFIMPGEWKTPIEDATCERESFEMGLRDALDLCSPYEDCGAWFCEVDGRADYRTGAVETRALHPPRNITNASYARLRRLLKIRG